MRVLQVKKVVAELGAGRSSFTSLSPRLDQKDPTASLHRLGSFQRHTAPTTQKYRNFRVEVRVTNLQCPSSSQCLQYKNTASSGRTFALQTSSVLQVHNAYNTKIQKLKGGRSRYKLVLSFKVHNAYNSKIQKLQGGGSRYKPVLSFKVHNAYNSTIQNLQGGRSRYKLVPSFKVHNAYKSKIQKLQDGRSRYKLVLSFKVHNTYNSNIQKLQGGRWRYPLVLSFKLTTPTIQRYRNFRVDVRVTNLYCPLKFTMPTIYNSKVQKLQGGRSRYKLAVSFKFTSPAIQEYSFFRVDVCVANF